MTPEEIGAHVAAHVEGATVDVSFGQVTVDVPAERWVDAATFARDDARVDCRYFDFLSAYDDRDAGTAVVLHLWSARHRHQLMMRTHVATDGGTLPTLTSVWAGANWHERETFEMFGVVFEDHPNLVSLLLPDGFEGHPLRKDFVLASRVAKAWPGAKEPGESDHDLAGAPPARRRAQPPGVPDPAEWGPEAVAAGDVAVADEPVAAADDEAAE
jgi:NADH-quinone oxidoreductase subunit C